MADTDNSSTPSERRAALLAAIGSVASIWAELEHEINRAIWALTSMSDGDGACVTAQILAILPRMRALIALAHRSGSGEELLKDLNKFSGVVEGLGRRRNRIIHDPWFVKTDESEFGRLEITADRRLVFEIRPESPAEVLEVSDEILNAIDAFSKLRQRINDDLTADAKERIGARLGTDSANFQGQLNLDNETE